jgi:mono/diheme cytochrome c family protein
MKLKIALMISAAIAITLLLAACGRGPTVTVSVQAVDPMGGTLHYRWKSTDGTIKDVDAPTTSWTLPTGAGLHFAYVLVSNSKGGYTERRIAVSTDSIGTTSIASLPVNFDAPAKPASDRIVYKALVRGSTYHSSTDASNGVYLPDIPVYLRDVITGNVTSTVTTDLRGTFVIPDAMPGAMYERYCQIDAGQPFTLCYSVDEFTTRAGEAVNDTFHGAASSGRDGFVGRVVLADGQPCGMYDEFFGVGATARVTLLDNTGGVLAGPYRANPFGHYAFSANSNAASIRIECENAAVVKIPVSNDPDTTPRTVIADSTSPVVNSMSARFNGSEVGIFLPPPSGVPSDAVADPYYFLSYKGIDSRVSACQYYLAIGAVKSCDANGNPSGAIKFNDWLRKTGMEPFARNGQHDIKATYVNRVDLNLTREHHSISYGPDQLAAYVCNHLGPTDDSQTAIDTAISNAVSNKNLVACVAMDHSVTHGVNNDKPFTRFLTFGPSGELLLSINLDGRSEKFLPGTCVACHGGDRYAGHFPTDGQGQADIGSHFLPYDSGNFEFSTTAGLTENDQQQAIYLLNQNLLNGSEPNDATRDLIDGWYASGTTALNKDYLPASWQGQSADDVSFYQHVYARSCRTCHVAMIESLNMDNFANVDPSIVQAYPDVVGEDARFRTSVATCSSESNSFLRINSMPNSLRTYNLFFGSKGTAVDQTAILGTFVANPDGPCNLPNTNPAP